MKALTTRYLGLELKNPIVPSASPLSREMDTAKRLEDAGAGALVMYSLFEEELNRDVGMRHRLLEEQDIGHPEAESFLPVHHEIEDAFERYLAQLERLKASLEIPVVASLNGVTESGWLDAAEELEEAGADALELNAYFVAADPETSGAEIERRYVDLLAALKRRVSIPVAMKLSPQFSSVAHMVRRLEEAGADGVALFNRFYQPDIDVDALRIASVLHTSTSIDTLLPMRWIAALHGRVDLTLAATGGVHTAEDALKMLLAGADVVHLCSVLIDEGPERLGDILEGVAAWLEESEFDSLDRVRGMLSQRHARSPAAYARAGYVQIIEGVDYGLEFD